LGVFLLAAPAFGGEPQLRERKEDLASLAAHLREGTKDLRKAYAEALEEAGGNRGEIESAVERCATRREKLLTIWLASQLRGKAFLDRKDERWESKKDLETLKGEHLRRNVRYALAARDRFPWCRSLSWELFLHFVLPHRGSQERAQDYRPRLWETLLPLVDEAGSAAEALRAVNRWASGRVKFEGRSGPDLGVLEILEAGTGRREDLANFLIACASTVGVPCTSVYTPWWPKKDGNHVWNEAHIGGRWRSFTACEPEEEGDPFDRMKKDAVVAKVYRNRFVSRTEEEELFGEDVTSLYTPVKNLALEVDRASVPLRLAVWNYQGWRVVGRGRADENSRVRFRNVGCRESILTIVYHEGENAAPAAGPLLFHTDGRVERLKVDPLEPGEPGLEAVKMSGLMPNANYAILAYVGGEWTALARAFAPFTGEADFDRVGRTHTLYIIVRVYTNGSAPEGRPFLLTFKNGKPVPIRY
jgi:hypothetical protein